MAQLLELSWLVVGIFLFVGFVGFVFRPSASRKYEEAGKIPLERD